jgi:hypothetical protein
VQPGLSVAYATAPSKFRARASLWPSMDYVLPPHTAAASGCCARFALNQHGLTPLPTRPRRLSYRAPLAQDRVRRPTSSSRARSSWRWRVASR